MPAIRPDLGMQIQAHHGFGSGHPAPEPDPITQAIEHWLFEQGQLSEMPVDQPRVPLDNPPMSEQGYTDEQSQQQPDLERLFQEMAQEQRMRGKPRLLANPNELEELGYPRTTGPDTDVQEAIRGYMGE